MLFINRNRYGKGASGWRKGREEENVWTTVAFEVKGGEKRFRIDNVFFFLLGIFIWLVVVFFFSSLHCCRVRTYAVVGGGEKKKKPQACGGIFASSEEGLCVWGEKWNTYNSFMFVIAFFWRVREEGSSSIPLLFFFFLSRAPTHFFSLFVRLGSSGTRR